MTRLSSSTIVQLQRNLRSLNVNATVQWEDIIMAWTKPNATSIACGMEINMYGPSEDEDHDLF